MSALWQIEDHLTERDIHIIEDLEKYRLLTTRQIQRLRLPATPYGAHVSVSAATRATTRILGRLEQIDVVRRLNRRIGGVKHGSALTIWQLGPVGERYVRARHGTSNRRRYRDPGVVFIEHSLAVRNILTEVHEHAAVGHYEVLTLNVEPDCWRSFTASGGETITLKPDLFVITADASTETHSFVEVDRATEHITTTSLGTTSAVLRKCHTYQRYHDTGIEQAAHDLFPAVVWIVPTMKRARQIRDAIDADRTLDPSLFWTITPEQALAQLAPYEPSTT